MPRLVVSPPTVNFGQSCHRFVSYDKAPRRLGRFVTFKQTVALAMRGIWCLQRHRVLLLGSIRVTFFRLPSLNRHHSPRHHG